MTVKKKEEEEEIEILNMDDLDIQELERRIELASTIPITPDVWSCGEYCPNLTCDSFDVQME